MALSFSIVPHVKRARKKKGLCSAAYKKIAKSFLILCSKTISQWE